MGKVAKMEGQSAGRPLPAAHPAGLACQPTFLFDLVGPLCHGKVGKNDQLPHPRLGDPNTKVFGGKNGSNLIFFRGLKSVLQGS